MIRLSEAIENFSKAVKDAVQILPASSLSEYLSSVDQDNLQLLLNLFEQQEEYELCDIIVKALNSKKAAA
mgnify:CR=1 FL=1